MTLPASRLWTRRMTNRSNDRPFLSPLYRSNSDTNLLSYSVDSDNNVTPAPPRPVPSSPSLYTPTEAIGILLGQSPTEAARSTRLAVEAATASLKAHSPTASHYYYSTPCTPVPQSGRQSSQTASNSEVWSAYLLQSLSLHQEEFNAEIDTAALATEVALHVLAPNHDPSIKPRKIRLISTFDLPPKENKVEQSPDSQGEKPARKGRARMSQEKRKRLARRKEREALLLGIPPKPNSAPPHLRHFPLPSCGLPTGQSQRDHTVPILASPWKQTHHPWYLEPQQGNQQINASRPSEHRQSISTSEGSRGRKPSAPPSLIIDTGSPSTQYTNSPSASPVTQSNANLAPSFQLNSNQSRNKSSNYVPWLPNEHHHSCSQIPRLSLQPPSPQHIRQQPDNNHLGLRNAIGNVSFPSLSDLR